MLDEHKEHPEGLHTPRLFLRRVRQDDAQDVFAIRSEPDVAKYCGFVPEKDVGESERWLAHNLARPDYYTFAIELRSEEREKQHMDTALPTVIGLIGIIRSPNVGYILNPDVQGQGYATEALKAFLYKYWDYAATSDHCTNQDHLSADIDANNLASRKVLEKCGFAFWELRRHDFYSPMLGWTDTEEWRLQRSGR